MTNKQINNEIKKKLRTKVKPPTHNELQILMRDFLVGEIERQQTNKEIYAIFSNMVLPLIQSYIQKEIDNLNKKQKTK